MAAPLDEIRVLEVANWLAAPAAAALMADLGADVVKVEPPGGDAFRGVLQTNSPDAQILPGFELDNRGKRSVAVDLERSGGPDLVRRLSAGADVFITNLTRHRVERYGLGFEEIRAINPRVVYVAFSGYGSSGPDADRGGFDYLAFWARSGVMGALGEAGDAPVMARGGQGDHTTSLNILAATLAGLRLRDQTGEAQRVEVTLQLTGMWTIGTDLQNALQSAAQPAKVDRRSPWNALANSYPTRDGRWLLLMMPQAERYWPRLCEAIREPGWATDERYDSITKLLARGAELAEALEQRFLGEDLETWRGRLDEAGCLWAPVAELPEVIADPQPRAMGAFATVEHPRAGPFEILNAPFRIEGADIAVRGAAPDVGAHTHEVLQEAGLSDEEIAQLAAGRVLG